MTKKMGCLVAVVVLFVIGTIGDRGIKKSIAEDKKRTADSVAALPPADRAKFDSAEAVRAYRSGFVNAKVDEPGLLRAGRYICPSGFALSEAVRLWGNDKEAAAKFAGERGCDISKAGREVIVDQLVNMGVRRVHYRGNPKPWYIESDGVASLTSSDADSLILKGKKR